MSTRKFIVSAAFLTLAATARAQLGPWQDGELLVWSVLPNQQPAIYRCNPVTGHGDVLVSNFTYAGAYGGMAYDSYRDQLLLSASFPPDSPLAWKLWAVNSNGTRVTIPGFDNEVLHALAPAGDGRVFFSRQASAAISHEIEWLDANDVAHTLLDASGTAPFVSRIEHLIYHAPSNALIATNSAGMGTYECTPGMGSIMRIPLSADGTRVGGPVTCVAYGTNNESLQNMDLMPGGDVLVTVGTGWFFGANFVRVNPVTLAITPFADPSHGDIDGGYYVAQLGKAVLLDDWNNELRVFAPGETGFGTKLPTDFIVSAVTSGLSPAELFFEVDVNGPGCFGYAGVYGQGTFGAGLIRPEITATGCPNVGSTFQIKIEKVVGGTNGMLFAGLQPSALPFVGGQLLTFPIAVTLALAVGGTPGQAGAGSVSFPVLLSDPALVGISFYLQGAFADPAANGGVSLTNGVQITLG